MATLQIWWYLQIFLTDLLFYRHWLSIVDIHSILCLLSFLLTLVGLDAAWELNQKLFFNKNNKLISKEFNIWRIRFLQEVDYIVFKTIFS